LKYDENNKAKKRKNTILLLTLILVPLSLFIGIAASAIGFTAWPLIVPVLFILCGFDLYLTLFSSLLVDCGNALVMTVIATKHGQINIRRGLLLAFFALVWIAGGIFLGKTFIPGNQEFFKGSAGIITVIIGILFIIKGIKNKPPRGSKPKSINEPLTGDSPVDVVKKKVGFRRFLIYAGVALMAFQIGFFGIGGGMGYAISLMLFLSYPVLKATGTAMLITFCSTLFAACWFFFLIPESAFLQLHVQWLIPMMVGLSMFGTIIGAEITYSLTERQINFLIGSVVVFAGVLATAQKLIIQMIY
jgi:uncharacterized membrane protein YfcA